MVFLFVFFFFQAEDGIRDTSVTGVQTCALPVNKNLRGVMVDLDQVGRESVCAIDVVDQMREFVVSNGFLIMLEHAPFRCAPKHAKIVGRSKSSCEYRNGDRNK